MNVFLEFPNKVSNYFKMSNYFFKSNLKLLRKKMRITQSELGFKLHKTHTSIGNWETGFNEPSMEDLTKIATIFGISIDKLINSDLSNVHLNENEVAEKNRQNVHLNVHPSVHLSGKKESKYVAKNEKLSMLEEPFEKGNSGQKLADAMALAIKALEALERANSRLERDLIRLEEENARLRAEIPKIGKKLAPPQARAG